MAEFFWPQRDSATAGDVNGPASSTNNAVVRFDGTTGKIIQDSVVIIGDVGAVTGVASLALPGGDVQTQIDTKVAKGGDTMTGLLTLSGDPSTPLQAATKQYVDSVAAGLDVKPSVVAATTANITLSGAQTLDGISVVATNRVLVKNQSAPAQNGIYIVAAGAWSRSTDMDSWLEVPGSFVFVEQGTLYADTAWVCTADSGGTLDTTAITWSQFAGAGTYTADGQGIELTGTQFSLELDGSTLNKSASGLKVANGGIGATQLGSLTSAELASKLSDETGSGAAVFATSPTLVTPALGTPASGVMTNVTGLPIDAGTVNTLPLNRGGTGQTTKAAAYDALSPLTTLGDVPYGGASGTGTRLAGNTVAKKYVMTQTGTGSGSAAPTWDFILDDGLNIVSFVDTTNLAGNVTLVVGDNNNRTYVASTTRDIVLPTTNIKKGMVIQIECRSLFELVIKSSAGTVLSVANSCNREASVTGGRVVLVALQDTPTTPAHWWVQDIYSYGSFTGTLTGCTTSPTQTFKYYRHNEMVTISPAGTLVAVSNTTACTITGMPTHIRPLSTRKIIAETQDSGVPNAGLWEIGTGGTITLRKDVSGGAFTASGNKGIGQGTEVSYTMV